MQSSNHVLEQVKIWFQNRRAKERKMNRKKLQQASTTTSSPPAAADIHTNAAIVASTSTGLLTDTLSIAIKEEY